VVNANENGCNQMIARLEVKNGNAIASQWVQPGDEMLSIVPDGEALRIED
jgi:hypothetical protein